MFQKSLPVASNSKQATLAGRLSEAGCTLTIVVNDTKMSLPVRERAFSRKVKLAAGPNRIRLVARDPAGNEQSQFFEIYSNRQGADRIPRDTWWKPTWEQAHYARTRGMGLWRRRPGMNFVLIPPGSYTREPLGQKVIISRPFYLLSTELTSATYRRVHRGWPAAQGTHPAVGVSWDEAKSYCRELSKLDGHYSYRLPTEAEWEYACRALTVTRYFWGNEASDAARYCNGLDRFTRKALRLNRPAFAKDDGFHGLAPAGRFLPNPWGLYDMLGNAAEW